MTLTLPARSQERYFLADRGVPFIPGSASIAASWVWAPALFTSAEVAYRYGWAGLAWFTIPNALVLLFFGYFGDLARRKFPNGFTLSELMGNVYSRRVRSAYLVQLSALATASFAVQLVAGGAVIALLTGWNYALVTVCMAAVAVASASISGIRGALRSDYLHIGLTLLVVVSFAPAVTSTVGWDAVGAGATQNTDMLALALAFGIPTTIGLMSGPFGDQSFWQRTFALKRTVIRKAFTLAAFIFAIVPLSMGVLGFASFGAGLTVDDPQMSNVAAVQQLLPSWTIVPFTLMVLGALISTMDNNLVSGATLAGHDLNNDDSDGITKGRAAMVLLAVIGAGVANIPGITVTVLFLIYGTLRASTFAPTVLTLVAKHRAPSERGVFWAIVGSLTIGLPVFFYGSFVEGASAYKTLGSILTIGIGTAVVLATRTKETMQWHR